MAVATVAIEGWPVDYELVGDGEPVVFAHASPFVSWYRPLIEALEGWATLIVRRPATFRPGLRIEDDADLLAGLVEHLRIERPHVVGHSYGGLVALSVAARGPLEVASVALLEPATMGLLEPSAARQRGAALLELARDRGAPAAMEGFLHAVCGAAGKALLERAVPEATMEAAAHAEGFFEAELPAAIEWHFGADDAASIRAPVLNMSGANSEPRFAEAEAIIHEHFPDAPRPSIPATHLMMAEAPREAARHLESFWRGMRTGPAP